MNDYSTIKYRTAEDLKTSLQNFDDAQKLRRALSQVRARQRAGFPEQKTKIALIEKRIHQLVGCRYRGCKKRATTVHCDYCKHPVCKEHKGPGNHGGLPEKGGAA